MTTFKKYMAAKTKVDEQQVSKTMNQNYFIRKEINEYDGESSTKGGEIDAIVFGALAIMGRTMKNAMVYMRLQSLKGPYLQQYELCGSSNSRTVFDDEYKGKKLDDYKQAEIELKQKKETIKEQIKAEKEKIEGRSEADTKKKEILDKKEEIAITKIEQDEQKIKVAKSRLDDEVSNKWDKEKRTLDAMADKISKTAEGFLLGGTFKKRWENEFSEAKLDIDQKVTELAREILSARGDKDAVAELNAKEAKIKEKQAELEAEAKDLEAKEEDDKAVEALKLVPSLPKLNNAKEEFTGFLNELKSQYEPEAEKEAPKKESKSYIIEEDANKDASPSEVINLMSKAYNNQEEENKPAFAAKVVKNIQAIKDFKKKVADIMVEVANECEKNEKELPSDIKGPFLKDGEVKEEITKNATDVQDLYKKELEDFTEKAKGAEEKGSGEGSDETPGNSDNEEGNNNNEEPTDAEKEKAKQLISRSEEEEEKHQKEVVEPIKSDLEKEKAKDPKDEEKIASLENDVAENEIQTLKLKLTTARLKAEAEGKNKNEDETYKSIMKDLLDKTDALDAKKSSEKTKKKEEGSEEKKESVSTDIPKKFMKFEDYLNMKEKNK